MRPIILAGLLTCGVALTSRAQTPARVQCAANDSDAAVQVRARLAEWVAQVKAGDRAGMQEVWAPGMVGWFPTAGLFGDSAAFAAAGLPPSRGPAPRPTYEISIDDIVAAGSIVVVHDIWTEMRDVAADRTVRRTIRGSELWRCQPDGRWRIARYVSAPEPWTLLNR